jgi:cobalt-zinc-cadmium efflux system protein
MGHAHDHSHTHLSAAGKHRGRLAIVLGVTLTILVVEIIGAVLTDSLALYADAGHMATDAAGIALALFAVWIAARPTSDDRTYGYYRAEILAAAINAVVLFGLGAFILYKATTHLLEPNEVESGPMLAFGLVAVAGNAVSLLLLRSSQSESLNLRGAFLEVFSDFLGSVAVIVAAIVVATTGFTRADAIASLAIGLMILPRSWRLLRDAVDVLLEATPRGMVLEDVRSHILETPGVDAVHDLHVWTITSGMPVISAHVTVAEGVAHGEVLDSLGSCLAHHFDIEHSTFQLEPAGHQDHEGSLHS